MKGTRAQSAFPDKHTALSTEPEHHPVEVEQASTTVASTPQWRIYSSRNMEMFETIQNEESFGSISPFMPASRLQNLPISILHRILECLLVSYHSLIIHADSETPDDYRSHVHPEALASCRLLYQIGMPILRQNPAAYHADQAGDRLG